MSTCVRCGATFSCAMIAGEEGGAVRVAGIRDKVATSASAVAGACWCTYLPAAVALPSEPGGACWCPSCLQDYIAAGQPREAGQA